MECKRWEEMDSDCLAKIFTHLGIDDRAVAVPFVCGSWYKASLDPLCWRVLDFTKRFRITYSSPRFSFRWFLRFAIGRSSGKVVELKIPSQFASSVKDLEFASNECRELKSLELPNLISENEVYIPDLIGKWKDLEQLDMESKPSSFPKLCSDQISTNCAQFRALKMHGAIKEDDACAFVKFLPKLRCLELNKSYSPKEHLLAIMKGGKELERLCVRDCIGFEAEDEVLETAARIKTFKHEGSKLINDNWYDTDHEDDCDYRCVQIIC